MLRLLSIVWAYVASWFCSALVHVADSGISGITGLANPLVITSISVVALILFGPVLASWAAYDRKRWSGFWIAIAAFAVGLGLVVALTGFGGFTAAEWWLAFGGMSLLLALVFAAAAVPMICIERLRAVRYGDGI